MSVRLDSPVYNGAVLLDAPTAFPDTGMQVLNGPFEAYSGQTVTLRLDREPAAGATYAGLSVTLTGIIADGDDWLADLTIPDREAEGLGVGYTHFIVVTSAADAEDEATTQNTLAAEPDVHVWHVIDGYDALEDKSESIWWDGDDEGSYLAKDGDLGIVKNPNNLSGLTVTAAEVIHSTYTVAMRFDFGGQSLVHSGDTCYCTNLVELARGADVLVHDVCMAPSPAFENNPAFPNLYEHLKEHHATPAEAGRTARESGVRKLVLTHFLLGARLEQSLEECRAEFDGEIIIAEDLMTVDCN